MTAFGHSAGARHKRHFGCTKNLRPRLPREKALKLDHLALGAASMFWSIIQCTLPTEFVQACYDKMAEEAMPSVFSDTIPEGKDTRLKTLTLHQSS